MVEDNHNRYRTGMTVPAFGVGASDRSSWK